jgi:hypothetical protein
MAAHKKYPDELRERAVRMVFEIRERDGKGRGEIAQVVRLAAVGARSGGRAALELKTPRCQSLSPQKSPRRPTERK